MKFIGLFLILITSISLQHGISFSNLAILFLGLIFTLSEVIFFWIKEEIKSNYRRR